MSAFSSLSHWFVAVISHFPCQKPSKNQNSANAIIYILLIVIASGEIIKSVSFVVEQAKVLHQQSSKTGNSQLIVR